MLTYSNKSIFESDAQWLVNPVNCVGVMGKGLAAKFKAKYPIVYDMYRKDCQSGCYYPGFVCFYYLPGIYSVLICNFATKYHWADLSKLEWIEKGLQNFANEYTHRRVKSIAFPKLGCGNGGLDWKKVRPLMVKYLGDLPLDVTIHL